MIQAFRLAQLRILLLALITIAFGACDGTDRLTTTTSDNLADATPSTDQATWHEALSFSSSSRGGIPFGVFHLPNDLYGTTYNGAVLYSYPEHLLANLAAAKRAGAMVIVNFVGGDKHYKDSRGRFSLAKWKQRVDRYRKIDFSSYVADGTIVGHYILDEPYDPTNWNGTLVSRATVDELARYSKQLWSSMPTIVRAQPGYLKGYRYKYLDAAWAQYSERKGDVSKYISINVQDAKATGLALIVGMNLLDGGTNASGIRGYKSGFYSMSASQLRSWGAVMLEDSYPCAFVSWQYSSSYLSRGDIKSAMSYLSQKARDHAARSCRASDRASAPATERAAPAATEQATSPIIKEPLSGDETRSFIILTVKGWVTNKRQYMTLTWSGAGGSNVDVYRNGAFHIATENDQRYTNVRKFQGVMTYVYQVCETGTSKCSNPATAAFR